MNKLLIRFVALFLVPCLITDPCVASLAPSGLWKASQSPASPQTILFTDQALISQALQFLRTPLKSDPRVLILHEETDLRNAALQNEGKLLGNEGELEAFLQRLVQARAVGLLDKHQGLHPIDWPALAARFNVNAPGTIDTIVYMLKYQEIMGEIISGKLPQDTQILQEMVARLKRGPGTPAVEPPSIPTPASPSLMVKFEDSYFWLYMGPISLGLAVGAIAVAAPSFLSDPNTAAWWGWWVIIPAGAFITVMSSLTMWWMDLKSEEKLDDYFTAELSGVSGVHFHQVSDRYRRWTESVFYALCAGIGLLLAGGYLIWLGNHYGSSPPPPFRPMDLDNLRALAASIQLPFWSHQSPQQDYTIEIVAPKDDIALAAEIQEQITSELSRVEALSSESVELHQRMETLDHMRRLRDHLAGGRPLSTVLVLTVRSVTPPHSLLGVRLIYLFPHNVEDYPLEAYGGDFVQYERQNSGIGTHLRITSFQWLIQKLRFYTYHGNVELNNLRSLRSLIKASAYFGIVPRLISDDGRIYLTELPKRLPGYSLHDQIGMLLQALAQVGDWDLALQVILSELHRIVTHSPAIALNENQFDSLLAVMERVAAHDMEVITFGHPKNLLKTKLADLLEEALFGNPALYSRLFIPLAAADTPAHIKEDLVQLARQCLVLPYVNVQSVDLLMLAQASLPESLRETIAENLLEPLYFRAPEAFTRSVLEALHSKFKDLEGMNYLLYYTAMHKPLHVPAVASELPYWHRFQNVLGRHSPVLVEYNAPSAGRGDEIIAMTSWLEGLLASGAPVTLYTRRPELYGRMHVGGEWFADHPNLTLVDLRMHAAPENDPSPIQLRWRNQPFPVITSAQLTVILNGETLPISIHNPQMKSVYAGHHRLAAQLGLSFRHGLQPPAPVVFTEARTAREDAYWATVLAQNTELRPVVVFNGFGGTKEKKGFERTPAGQEQFRQVLRELIARDCFVVLLSNGKPWGMQQVAEEVISGLNPDDRRFVSASPDNISHTFLYRRGDLGMTVEGGGVHTLLTEGLPMLAFQVPGSFEFSQWFPSNASNVQAAVTYPALTHRLAEAAHRLIKGWPSPGQERGSIDFWQIPLVILPTSILVLLFAVPFMHPQKVLKPELLLLAAA